MSHSAQPASRRRLVVAAATAAVGALAGGCVAPNRTLLVQPTAPPAQRRVELATRSAFFERGEGRVRALLAYPLPGSLDGPRDFLVYFDLPARDGRVEVSPAPGSAGGFLIQRKGFRRGKTVFSSGSVQVRRRWLDADRLDVTLDVECDDRTRIRGRVTLRCDPREVSEFATLFAADVGLLAVSRSAASSRPAPTGPSGGGGEGAALASPPRAPIIAPP